MKIWAEEVGRDRALVLGLESTALIFFFMNDGVDSGDIFSEEEMVITSHDNVRTLYDKVVQRATIQIIKFLPQYEMLSETDFRLGVSQAFRPNVFINIGPYLDLKLRAMDIYSSEFGNFPFPRSQEVIRALAMLRGGAASGFQAAEAFGLLR